MERESILEKIVNVIRGGEKPSHEFKIGAEFEHIVVEKNTYETVGYYGEKGIESVLKQLLHKGYRPKYEGTYLIGLEQEDKIITLEPGGQVEVSIRPCSTLMEMKAIYLDFIKEITPILEEQEQYLMSIGYHPKTSIERIPFNPKQRYEHMGNYLKNQGKYAHNMMKGTASLQVVVDYQNEEDFIKKMKVAHYISPLLSLISDNAPVFEGEIYEKQGLRMTIWENTDKERSGIIPGVLSGHFGYREYGEYILNTPPIFIMKEGELVFTGGKKASEVMDFHTANQEETAHLLTMVFPDVRAKSYIEIRMGDALPYPFNFAYIALVKGIFYNDIVLSYLYELAQEVDDDKIQGAKLAICERGFMARLGCKTMYDLARVLFDLAKKGLNAEEREMLKPLEEIIIQQKNLASISKERIERIGLEGIKYCTLNSWGKGDGFSAKRDII